MTQPTRGRPRSFDRDRALLDAARLFWRRGYSGTSTRDLTSALGLSTSSLYAAFGSKAGLFEEAVRTYAERYREIYREAVKEPDLRSVVERILVESVREYTRPADTHPGCLLSSAAMTDSTGTLDTTAYFEELHGWNERALRARVQQADAAGELTEGTDVDALTGVVQAVVHGLSVQSNLGADQGELMATARLAHEVIGQHITP
ncbi:TetR/AcrR family transcriptional regulator [Streptomyces sp. NPDC001941]|uniref:TetR/AcrR family transcriptional regulator n=1 Tax=Streptomyces sp. NPDC001941 TaxID=3154659 RepID=UPI00331E73A9